MIDYILFILFALWFIGFVRFFIIGYLSVMEIHKPTILTALIGVFICSFWFVFIFRDIKDRWDHRNEMRARENRCPECGRFSPTGKCCGKNL